MKTGIILILVALFLTTHSPRLALAQDGSDVHILTGIAPVCTSYQNIRLMVQIYDSHDEAARSALIDGSRCFMPKPKINVFVTGREGRIVEFRPKGSTTTMWTLEHGVELPWP